MMRGFDFAAKEVWAIEPTHLKLILDVAQRINEPDFEAVAQRRAERVSKDGLVRRFGGVAVIDVIGPIFRYANLFTQISGATSIDDLALGFRSAADDEGVKSILLNIDSPGGGVAGTSELAQAIRQAADAKPVVAYVDDMAASGAMWIASGANAIVAADTALIGSIGVVAAITKQSDRPGVKTYEFVSSVSPLKRPDLETDKGRAAVQAIVDDLGRVFVSALAANRGVSEDKVLADFGQGGLMVAARALEAGMIDQVGTFEDLLARMKAGWAPARPKFGSQSKAQRSQATPVASATKPKGGITVMETPNAADATRPPEPTAGAPPAAPPAPAAAAPAAAAPAAAAPAADIQQQIAAAVAGTFAAAKGVIESCALGGLTAAQALALLTPDATAENTRAKILAQRRTNGGRDLESHVLPEAGILDPNAAAGGQAPDPSKSPVVQAVERMFPAAAAKGGK